MTRGAADINWILGHLGDIGRFQARIYLLSCLPVFIAGVLSTSFVFTTFIPEHRCFVSECDKTNFEPVSVNKLFDEKFLTWAIPKEFPKVSKKYDACHQYTKREINVRECDPLIFNNQSQEICDQYVFNHQYFNSTFATDFNLYCSESWQIQILQSLFFVGILVGSLFNGLIADKYGRRIIFIILTPVLFVTLFLSYSATSVFLYGVSMVFKGICVAGFYQSAFTVGIEFLGGRWRFWLGNIYSIIFAIGSIYACLMAAHFRTWRMVEISNLFPSIPMLLYPFIFPESIRWQFSNGKVEQALEQICRAAHVNQINLPSEVLEITPVVLPTEELNKNSKVTLLNLFTHTKVRRWTITLLYIWFTNSLVYYGLAFLSSEINENIYLSMILLSLAELPGITLTSLAGEYFSRRRVLMTTMILGGISCILSALLAPSFQQLKMWLAILGKMNIAGSFALIYVYSAEIFPTVLRNSGIGISSVFSRFGGISAPYLLRLTLFGDYFPFFVIGVASLLAGLLSILLPETRNKKLPDTLDEMAHLSDATYVSTSGENSDEKLSLINNEM